MEVKALWAFRVYGEEFYFTGANEVILNFFLSFADFDEDEKITQNDIFKIADRLVLNHFIDSSAKEKICEVVR